MSQKDASGEREQTEWKPSQIALRLLEVRLDPEHRLKNIREMCRTANISPDSYYKLIDNPAYLAWEHQEAMRRLGRWVAPILMAYVKEGLKGSKAHGDVILEITGVYTPKTRAEITGRDGGPIETSAILSNDEVLRRLAEMGVVLPDPKEGDKPPPS